MNSLDNGTTQRSVLSGRSLMDAARAAAMSDPDRNPFFRRHWVEPVAAQRPPAVDPIEQEPVKQTGLELLHLWRRQKAIAEGTAR